MPTRRTRAFITTGYSARRRWPPPGTSSPGKACRPTGGPAPGR